MFARSDSAVHAAKSSRATIIILCAAVTVASGAALTAVTRSRFIDQSVAEALPTLRTAWSGGALKGRGGNAVSENAGAVIPSVMKTSAAGHGGPATGDEGFWLSARTLAGNTSSAFALGDRMTISDHSYVVIELKPMGGDSTNNDDRKAPLLLVVAKEIGSDGAAEPRLLRFLIETDAAGHTQRAVDSTLSAHRAL